MDDYFTPIVIECDARSVTGDALGQDRTFRFMLNDGQLDVLRAQIPRPKKEKDIIDKATEALISRLIGERIEAQMALKRIEMEGFQCSACGCYTNRSPK